MKCYIVSIVIIMVAVMFTPTIGMAQYYYSGGQENPLDIDAGWPGVTGSSVLWVPHGLALG